MGIAKIECYVCERCNHKWIARNKKEKPKVCPKCKSPYWDTPRRIKKIGG
ncbi:MAG: hypothetical protein KAT28_03775 [Candidatus Aenigmarchaeota archaeon]|nr:hypothetical protein [Candidatus Aenigmarchaeota archaeon]